MLSKIDYFENFKIEMKGWYIEKKRNKISIKKYIILTLTLLFILIITGFFLNETHGAFIIRDIIDKDGNIFLTINPGMRGIMTFYLMI